MTNLTSTYYNYILIPLIQNMLFQNITHITKHFYLFFKLLQIIIVHYTFKSTYILIYFCERINIRSCYTM